MRDLISHTLVPWHVRESGYALDHPWARVRRDVCITAPGAAPIEYFTFDGSDFAIVFALTEDDEVVLTRQYKHGIGDIVLELPAGIVDPGDASAEAAARRELLEETGLAGDDWTPLGVLFASPSKSTVRAHAFLARGVRRVAAPRLDTNEAIAVLGATPAELRALIQRGEFADAASVAVSLLALDALRR